MKPVYFCFGDYRSGKKEYRIFKVHNLQDAYKVADELGYEVELDSCLRFNGCADHTERMVISVLQTLEVKFNGMENVVACVRAEYDEAQRMKRHFLSSDMGLYFPKFLDKPVPELIPGPYGIPTMVTRVRRNYPWIIDYWVRKAQRGEMTSIDVISLDEEAKALLNAAIREKRK